MRSLRLPARAGSRPARRRSIAAMALAAATVCAGGRAQAPAPASQLERAASLDPPELALAAARVGEGELARLMSRDDADPRLRRIAVEAAAYAHAPIGLLAPLSRLAAGRDPELAPAAARVSIVVLEHVRAPDLAREEALPAALAPVRRAYRGLARDAGAREDLRSAGARLDAMLASLLE